MREKTLLQKCYIVFSPCRMQRVNALQRIMFPQMMVYYTYRSHSYFWSKVASFSLGSLFSTRNVRWSFACAYKVTSRNCSFPRKVCCNNNHVINVLACWTINEDMIMSKHSNEDYNHRHMKKVYFTHISYIWRYDPLFYVHSLKQESRLSWLHKKFKAFGVGQ